MMSAGSENRKSIGEEVKRRNILVTCFEPFGTHQGNSSLTAVSALPDEIDGCSIIRKVLPVSFQRAPEELIQTILETDPIAVLCIGQAGGRKEITPEQIAINLMDARMADNDGFIPKDVPVRAGRPDGWFTTLPVRKICEDLNREKIPASISLSAGSYVCNAVMYTLLDHVMNRNLNIPAGFIHVPYMDVQLKGKHENTPSMSREQITEGLRTILETVIQSLSEQFAC